MAKMTAWAHFHECKESADLASLAAAFAEAGEAAEAAGCEVSPAGEDAGDREVEAAGPPEAVARAAVEFEERGFEPRVVAEGAEELGVLQGLLPPGIGAEREAAAVEGADGGERR